MYRRDGGVEYRAEQNSPIESPPDLDLLNLIDFTASFSTPCPKENFQPMPMKMQLNNIVPTTSVIGSWMEEEIKPFKSVFESLKGLNPVDISAVESLLAERGSALNTPPPLPVLTDISDCITPPDTFDSVPVVVDIIRNEEEKGLSLHRSNCGESPLHDPSIENTVNLKDLFALHNFNIESGLLDDLNSDPYYLGDDQKRLITESYNQLGFDDSGAADAAVGCVDNITDNSLLYLPAVCLEEQIEETVVEDQKKPLLLELNNNFESGSTQFSASPEIITISVEEFNLLTGGGQREAGIKKSASISSFNQTRAPPTLANKPNQSAAVCEQEWNSTKKLATSKHEKKPSSASSRKRRIASLDKESDEYKDKRARNNESVRKSRDKAKVRQEETEGRLHVLSTENRRLQDRVDSLEKELSVLRGLFSSSGSSAPPCI